MNHRQQHADVVQRNRERLAQQLAKREPMDWEEVEHEEAEAFDARVRADRALERSDSPRTWMEAA